MKVLSDIQKILLFLFLLIVSIVGLIVIWKLVFSNSNSDYTFDTSRTSVVKEMQSLNRIETAQFTIEKIIDAQTSGGQLQQFLFGDKILLIAQGEVIAGFDLSQMKQSDIEVQGRDLILNLPPPQILVSKIDNDKTKIYDRTTGLLTKGDKDLESEARNEAEQQIRQAACDSDILGKASDNAKQQLKALFLPLGFNSITFNIPSGSCK